MKLAGDLSEFSLADLIQVAGAAGRLCRIRVMALEGNGYLELNGGEVVGASYEDLAGFDAFTALVAARAGHFQVEDEVAIEATAPLGSVQKLLLEANSRIDHGQVPRPRPRVAPAATAAVIVPPAEKKRPRAWIGGVAVALVLLSALSWLAFARRDAVGLRDGAASPAGAPASPVPPVAAIEAADLQKPGDKLPVLLNGTPPASPDPAATLKPTIVCRLLVDASGRVTEAKVYRSRLDLAAFEDAAVDAARQYHFAPGQRGGKAVPVWINWPMGFR